MDPIKRQDDHDDEIGNQHCRIERIPSVESVEVINSVRIMCVPIVAKAFGSEKQREESRRYLKERGQVDAPAKVPYQSILRDTMQHLSQASPVVDSGRGRKS